jgi:hypothetical protein
VVPNSFLPLIGNVEELVALALVDPDATHAVGLVASDRDPLPPIARAFLDQAKQINLSEEIDRQLKQLHR